MKIASFTQTYGDERFLELSLLQFDKVGKYIRNKCDIIIFSFHNCPDHFYKKAKTLLENIYDNEKLLLLRYNNISYLQSIRNTIHLLKTKHVNYMLQIQDDQHGLNTKENIENLDEINDLFTFLGTYDENLLHIYGNEGNKTINKLVPQKEVKVRNTEFYCYDTRDFKTINIFSWNDGTYFIKVEFMEKLFNYNLSDNVWYIELQLKRLFDSHFFERWGMNKTYFKASNIHGKNINRNLSIKDNLKRFFGELKEWKIIENNIMYYQ